MFRQTSSIWQLSWLLGGVSDGCGNFRVTWARDKVHYPFNTQNRTRLGDHTQVSA